MRYGIGAAISLADITGGVLSTGVVPRSRFTRFTGVQLTAGVVVTGVGNDILNLSIGTVYNDEVVVISFQCYGTKAGAAGLVRIQFIDDGSTSNWDAGFGVRTTITAGEVYVPAASACGLPFCIPLWIRGTGTLDVKFRGVSNGSNFTINANAASAFWWAIREV